MVKDRERYLFLGSGILDHALLMADAYYITNKRKLHFERSQMTISRSAKQETTFSLMDLVLVTDGDPPLRLSQTYPESRKTYSTECTYPQNRTSFLLSAANSFDSCSVPSSYLS
jgi:hypothetical protein